MDKKHQRRANGLGSVFYDNRSKRWIAQIVTGRSYSADMKVRFTYKRKSFIKRTDALKAISSMEAQNRPKSTLSHYFKVYQDGKYNNLSENKQCAYRIAYNRLNPLWNKRMAEITINDLQAVISASCVSYDPARDVRSLLNALFKLAAADDKSINFNLPSLLVLPKQASTQVEPFNEEEILKLWISYDNGNKNAAIPLIMCYTGMMTGELRKLTKSMIDLENKQITGAGLKTAERKKKAVLLPDDILPVLEDVISQTETDLLYPVHKETFYKRYYAALEEAEIERRLSPYSCRHTTATVLGVREQIPPQVLQRIMRWTSTKMADRYVTPSDQDARDAVNRI